jgi:hypothetical protein
MNRLIEWISSIVIEIEYLELFLSFCDVMI